MTAPALFPGQVVGGNYAVQSALSQPGLSVTYQALTAPSREVAIKLFDPALRTQQDALSLLERCRLGTNALPGNWVLHIGDSGFDPATGAPFQVTELSAHPSLLELVRLCPLSPIEASTLLRKLATVLDSAHSAGFAHLALKPTNVFVGPTPAFDVRLADFGVSAARRFIAGGEIPPGDAPWIAPEQVQAPGGDCSDVFSAALVMFFALTGRSYWRSCQALVDVPAWKQELRGLRYAASVRASDWGVELPATLNEVFSRALAVEVGARFSSVGEFAAAFEHAVRGAVAPRPALAAPLVPVPVPAPPPAMGLTMPLGSGTAAAPLVAKASFPPTLPYELPLSELPFSSQPPAPVPAPAPVLASSPPSAFPSSPPKPRNARWISWSLGLLIPVGALASWMFWRHSLSMPAPLSATPVPTTQALAVAPPASAEPPLAVASAEPAPAPSALAASAPIHENAEPALPIPAEPNADAVLTVVCEPECDTLFIDNQQQASPTAAAQIHPGTHAIAAAKAGYLGQAKKVTLTAGQNETVMFKLPKRATTPAKTTKPCGKFLKRCD